jgi:hypothetical protein
LHVLQPFSAKGRHRLAKQPLGLVALGHLCLLACQFGFVFVFVDAVLLLVVVS